MDKENVTRDYNKEYKDNTRKYAYDFDYTLRDFMMRTFNPFFIKGKALEMGCYIGEFTKKILQVYDDVTVIEASDELVEAAKKNVGPKVKFILSTFEQAEIKEKYDCIFLMHTLEHLDQPVEILKKIKEWLSDKGRLFLVVPNANAASRQIAVKMGLIPYNHSVIESERLHGHNCTYTLDTLENVARQAELKIITRGGVFFKALSGSQYDEALKANVITKEYLEGCYQLGMIYPDLCSSIYLICEKE
ncbi:MAG: class I SAM-dependent methyltransferase [Bacteroidetes bacterium]|nr:class I SAM-dependent methyltransferase [Bacteroidota bacterium]